MNLEQILDEWIAKGNSVYYKKTGPYKKIVPKIAYDCALELIKNRLGAEARLSQYDIDSFFNYALQKKIFNPKFSDYGIFVSALVNLASGPEAEIVLPTKLLREEGLKREETLLNYLGYRFSSGTLFIDGNAGDYCFDKVHGKAFGILNGNAGDYFGRHQNGESTIVALGKKVGNYALRKQKGGTALIYHAAGNYFCNGKTGGDAYALGPVGRKAGLKMKGGTLFCFSDVGKELGVSQDGGDIFVCGRAKSVETGSGKGGTLVFIRNPVVIPQKFPRIDEIMAYCSAFMEKHNIKYFYDSAGE